MPDPLCTPKATKGTKCFRGLRFSPRSGAEGRPRCGDQLAEPPVLEVTLPGGMALMGSGPKPYPQLVTAASALYFQREL